MVIQINLSWLIEFMIRDAIQKGEFENLPGEGKPLELKTPNPFESKEQSLISRMMKSAGVLPVEIVLLKEIEQVKQKLETCETPSEKDLFLKKLGELQLKYEIQMEARRNFFAN